MSAAHNSVQRQQPTRLARFKRDLQVIMDWIKPRHRRTTRAERLAMIKVIAKDPEVDRALRRLLDERRSKKA